MRWEDERYVRLYTRDTVTWKLLPWQAKALLPLILRKLDRAGLVDLDSDSIDPVEAVCALTDMPPEVVAPGLSALMKADIFRVGPMALVMPKFLEAQEAIASDAQRKREQRARDRDRIAAVEQVTLRDETSRAVTDGHAESRAVTPNLTVPTRAVPNLPNQQQRLLVRKIPDPQKVEKPDKPKAEWRFVDWEQWAQWKRQEAGIIPEPPIPIIEGDVFWQAVMRWTGDRVEPLCQAFLKFGDSPYWQKQKPPLPIRGFISQWDKFMPVKEAQRAS